VRLFIETGAHVFYIERVFNSRPDTVVLLIRVTEKEKIKRGQYSVDRNGTDRNEKGSLKIPVD